MASRRMATALLVAVGAHAGIFLIRREVAGARSPAMATVTVTEIDVEPPPQRASEPTGAGAVAAAAMAPPRGAPSGATHPAQGEAPNSAEAATDSAETMMEGARAWSFSPTTTNPDAGALAQDRLNAAFRAGVRQTVDEETARAAKLPTYTAHDMALGLVPGSGYTSLARDVVRNSRAPDEGHAVLELRTDAAGSLVDVVLVDASSDRDAWQEVAEMLRAAHPPQTQRIPANARGVAVTIDVTSTMRTTDGNRPAKGAMEEVLRDIGDPVGGIVNAQTPLHRAVTARIVDVRAF